MATLPASSIINRVSILLQDAANVRWPRLELLDWLNDGQREVALYKPNACVRNIDVTLAAGTKQAIPADGNSLVDIPRNTNGMAIRLVARGTLDVQVPDWHLPSKASAKVAHYCYSEHDPKNFYVYPPSPGGNSVEIVYNANPADAALGGAISIDDIYASALVDYVMYRAYSKDTEYAANGQTASNHYQAFIAAIRGKVGAEVATDPNARGNGTTT
ncbi:DUF6682 family protein [Herminiimonas sp. CN]|uniref:phage adaptor protein n=1 Tax=Herminiimonas sp. CN TaxID=1349818 RepID=UPI0004733B85|nr:DUF6682 family protein [Herminiimonas sp. CN]